MIAISIRNLILDSLKINEVTILISARQVGKSTVLERVIINLKNTIYFNGAIVI